MAEASGDRELQAMATMYLAGLHNARGDYRRAIELLRWTLDLLKDDPQYHSLEWWADPPAVFLQLWFAKSLAELGQFAEATFTARKRSGSRRRPTTVLSSH